jgi:hypothetical protein
LTAGAMLASLHRILPTSPGFFYFLMSAMMYRNGMR